MKERNHNSDKQRVIKAALGHTGDTEWEDGEAKLREEMRQRKREIKALEGLDDTKDRPEGCEQLKGQTSSERLSIQASAETFEVVAEGYGEEAQEGRPDYQAYRWQIFAAKDKIPRPPQTPNIRKTVAVLLALTVAETVAISAFFYGQGSAPTQGTALLMGGGISLINVLLSCFLMGYLALRHCLHPESRLIQIFSWISAVMIGGLLGWLHMAAAYVRVTESRSGLLNLFHDYMRIFDSYDGILVLVLGICVSILSIREGFIGFSDRIPDYAERYDGTIKRIHELVKEEKLDALEDVDATEEELLTNLDKFEANLTKGRSEKKNAKTSIKKLREEFTTYWENTKNKLESDEAARRETIEFITGKRLRVREPLFLNGEGLDEPREDQKDEDSVSPGSLHSEIAKLQKEVRDCANQARSQINAAYKDFIAALFGKMKEKGGRNNEITTA